MNQPFSPIDGGSRWTWLIPCLMAFGTGALLLGASPGLGNLPLLAWFALIPLLYAISGRQPARAAFLGLLCGLAYYTPLLSWIVTVLATYGQVPRPLALAAMLLLALYMSCYLAIFAFLCAKTEAKIPLLLSAPLFWVALDLIRGWLFTGFPWLDLGYTQYRLPQVIQVADLFGHHGVSFLIVLANLLGFTLIAPVLKKQTNRQPVLLLTALLILPLAYGYSQMRSVSLQAEITQAPSLEVGIVQGNIRQDLKWQPEFQQQIIDDYLRLSAKVVAADQPQLLVWPETAMPFYPYEHFLFQTIGAVLIRPHQVALLAGAPHREWRGDRSSEPIYSNSAFLIGPDGLVKSRYDKQHLVPFGEYIPLRKLLAFASPIVETLGDFVPGRAGRPMDFGTSRIGVLICFESIFPNLARQQAAAGANLLVNLTNDAWFGRSGAPWQHLAMAVFRAVETRKALVRSANTGVSTFISPLGQIEAPSQLFTEYTASRSVPLLDSQSPYVRWGYLFPLFCLLLSTVIVLYACSSFSRRILAPTDSSFPTKLS